MSSAGGGAGYWWVLLSGVSHNSIANLDPSSMSSSSSSAAQASVVTVGGGTTIVSTLDPNATDSQHANKSSGGSSNTVGIAVGVVVGIVVLGAIIGGVLFFLRRRQRNLAQQDYEQKQQVQQFVAGGKGYNSNSQTSMGDSRLDPEVMMSRRQSDGSIMDNADYSRRILKVRPSPINSHTTSELTTFLGHKLAALRSSTLVYQRIPSRSPTSMTTAANHFLSILLVLPCTARRSLANRGVRAIALRYDAALHNSATVALSGTVASIPLRYVAPLRVTHASSPDCFRSLQKLARRRGVGTTGPSSCVSSVCFRTTSRRCCGLLDGPLVRAVGGSGTPCGLARTGVLRPALVVGDTPSFMSVR